MPLCTDPYTIHIDCGLTVCTCTCVYMGFAPTSSQQQEGKKKESAKSTWRLSEWHTIRIIRNKELKFDTATNNNNNKHQHTRIIKSYRILWFCCCWWNHRCEHCFKKQTPHIPFDFLLFMIFFSSFRKKEKFSKRRKKSTHTQTHWNNNNNQSDASIEWSCSCEKRIAKLNSHNLLGSTELRFVGERTIRKQVGLCVCERSCLLFELKRNLNGLPTRNKWAYVMRKRKTERERENGIRKLNGTCALGIAKIKCPFRSHIHKSISVSLVFGRKCTCCRTDWPPHIPHLQTDCTS